MFALYEGVHQIAPMVLYVFIKWLVGWPRYHSGGMFQEFFISRPDFGVRCPPSGLNWYVSKWLGWPTTNSTFCTELPWFLYLCLLLVVGWIASPSEKSPPCIRWLYRWKFRSRRSCMKGFCPTWITGDLKWWLQWAWKTNMSPENQWLEDVFSYWNSPFSGTCSFSGVYTEDQWTKCWYHDISFAKNDEFKNLEWGSLYLQDVIGHLITKSSSLSTPGSPS